MAGHRLRVGNLELERDADLRCIRPELGRQVRNHRRHFTPGTRSWLGARTCELQEPVDQALHALERTGAAREIARLLLSDLWAGGHVERDGHGGEWAEDVMRNASRELFEL